MNINQRFAFHLYITWDAEIFEDKYDILYAGYMDNLFDEFSHLGLIGDFKNQLNKISHSKLFQLQNDYAKNLELKVDISHFLKFMNVSYVE